jgi:penicillin-binding protein 1A
MVLCLQQFIPESKDVMNKDVAYAIVKLLEGVTESGTGTTFALGWC